MFDFIKKIWKKEKKEDNPNSFVKCQQNLPSQEGTRKEAKKKSAPQKASSALIDKRFIQILKILKEHTERLDKIEKTIEPKELKEELTQLEKKMCHIIQALLSETQKEMLAVKEIAEEMYPSKPYEKSRPIIMKYLKRLEEKEYVKKNKTQEKILVEPTEKIKQKKKVLIGV